MALKLVDSETADLLREIGFDEIVKHFYKDGYVENMPNKNSEFPNTNNFASAPYQEYVNKWLREKYGFNVEIDTPDMVNQGWSYSIHIIESFGAVNAGEGYDTYEKALEEGIKGVCADLKKKTDV
jgi:hypothetical protein